MNCRSEDAFEYLIDPNTPSLKSQVMSWSTDVVLASMVEQGYFFFVILYLSIFVTRKLDD